MKTLNPEDVVWVGGAGLPEPQKLWPGRNDAERRMQELLDQLGRDLDKPGDPPHP